MTTLSHNDAKEIGAKFKERITSRVFNEKTLTAGMDRLGREEDASITSCQITAMLVGDLARDGAPIQSMSINPGTNSSNVMEEMFDLADQGNFMVVEFSPQHFFSFSTFGNDYYQVYQGYQKQFNLIDWLSSVNNDGKLRKITVIDEMKRLFNGNANDRGNAAETLFSHWSLSNDSRSTIRNDFVRQQPRFKSIVYFR